MVKFFRAEVFQALKQLEGFTGRVLLRPNFPAGRAVLNNGLAKGEIVLVVGGLPKDKKQK